MKLKSSDVLEWLLVLLIVGAMALAGNMLGYKESMISSLPGMLILVAVSLVGLVLAKVVPGNIPAIAFIGVIGLVISIPGVPFADQVTLYTSKIQMLPLATPVLAYSGIAIGKSWGEFTKLGWRSIVVTLCVMFGTFIGSALIAECILKVQGII